MSSSENIQDEAKRMLKLIGGNKDGRTWWDQVQKPKLIKIHGAEFVNQLCSAMNRERLNAR